MLNGGDLFACNYCKYTCSTLSMIKIHIEKNHLQCEVRKDVFYILVIEICMCML